MLFLVLLSIWAGFLVNSFLGFSVTGEFRIAHFGVGPTELRAFVIVINTLVATMGAAILVELMIPVISLSGLILAITIYRTQRKAWAIDRKNE